MFARPLTLNVKGNVTRVPIRENSREPRIVVNRMDGQVKRGGVTGPVGFVQSPVFSGNCTDLLQLERLRFSDDDHGSIARKIGPLSRRTRAHSIRARIFVLIESLKTHGLGPPRHRPHFRFLVSLVLFFRTAPIPPLSSSQPLIPSFFFPFSAHRTNVMKRRHGTVERKR